MKNILIPTDFSENADKALDFALALAHKFGATLHILHAYHSTSHAGHLSNVNRVIKEDREKEMDAFMEATKASISFDLDIQGYCTKGYPVEKIESFAQRLEVDLIVMGTLGASNLGKQMMGSTTSNLIKNTKTPVLAIPADVIYSDLENMVVALDALNTPQPHMLSPMVNLAQELAMKISLVHVSNSKIHTDIDPSIKNYLDASKVDFSYEKAISDDVLAGILEFTNNKGNSLLCIIAHQRTWFQNIFHDSVSKKVALRANMPLLILQDVAEA